MLWSTTSASSLPLGTFGPVGGRFVVSFGAATKPIDAGYTLVTEGDWKLQMRPKAIGYVAALGGNAYEEVDVAIYPHVPGPGNVVKYLEWNAKPGGELRRWHGLPGAYEDQACREGDSPITCPGQIAVLWIVRGRVVFELYAARVGQIEVDRFFGSFRPTRSSTLR